MAWSDDSLQSFRVHRHDVLNGLQLIRGYIQMNRSADALVALDRMAEWIQCLTTIHNLSSNCTKWLEAASRASHIILTGLTGMSELSQVHDHQLSSMWLWLEEQASIHGVRAVYVSVSIVASDVLQLKVMDPDSTLRQWTHEADKRGFSHCIQFN